MVAFLSVLLSSTAALKEIAFMLTARILVDCFITTKIIIPASVGLTGALTFWPRVFKETGNGGAFQQARMTMPYPFTRMWMWMS